MYTCASGASREAHGKLKTVKLEALARLCCAVLRLSVRKSVSEVNRSGGDTLVVSCHRYLVVFHPFDSFVEQLTILHTAELILASSIFRVGLSLTSILHAIARWHPGRHVPKGT